MTATPTQPAPEETHAASPQEDAYVALHHARNVRLYLVATFFNTISSAFGDPSVLMTNLGTLIGAPGWVRVLPGVAGMTLSYIAVILMGWWMTPQMSRKKLFFWTVSVTYAMTSSSRARCGWSCPTASLCVR